MKLIQIKKQESFLIPILFIIFIIWAGINTNNKEKNIQENGKTIVGKYISYETGENADYNYFVYYINGTRYKKTGGGEAPEGFSGNIGKFYKIKYSEKNPENILALYDQEVTDTIQIIDGGYPKDRLLNISSSSYLFPDNK